MRTFKAIFKCRLCGKTYYEGTCCNHQDTVKYGTRQLCVGQKPKEVMFPTMQELHYCEDNFEGSIGIADFQGWKNEKDRYEIEE